jgi:hypothetical protein
VANPEQIEQELKEYLTLEKNLRTEDRLEYLMAIINKHFAIDKIGHSVTHHDLSHIVGQAKAAWVDTAIPIYISKKEVHHSDTNYVLVIEAFVGYLNRNNLLKRLVKFDRSGR